MKIDLKYILKRILIGVGIILVMSFINSCEVKALEISQKIGNSYVNGNSYFSISTSQVTQVNMSVSYLYDLSEESDSDFANKYNLISAPTGTGTAVYKKTYYFVLSYCSNVGASVIGIRNINYNFIDANYNTQTVCYANGYIGTLFNAYIRMAPTSANVGNSTIEIVYFNNSLDLQSRFSYNGYIGFNALNILTYDEYQKAIDNRSILYQQQVLNDSINAMKDQSHQDSINEQNAINSNTSAVNNNTTAVDNQTNTIKDDSVDNPSSYFTDFQNKLATNGVITQLVTLPISLFTKILSSINGTCTNFVLGDLFESTLTLPCIQLSDYLGSTLWNIIDILFSGFFVYAISKRMIKVFENLTSMKESDDLE